MRKPTIRQPLKEMLIAFAGLVALVCVAVAIYWHEINVLPNVVVPTPTMPKPNAFDYFVSAANLEVRKDDVGNVITTGPILHFWGTGSNMKTIWSPVPKYTVAQKDEIAHLNEPALSKLKAGLNYAYMSPPVRSYNNLSGIYLSKMRDLARLLKFYGQVAAERRDLNSAIEDYMDADQTGEMVPHGSGELGRLVGDACSTIGRRPIWSLVDRLTSSQARMAIAHLEIIRHQEYPLAETFRQEKWTQEASLQEALRQPGYPAGTVQWFWKGDDADEYAFQKPDLVAGYLTSKRRIMEDTTIYWDNRIQQVQSPGPFFIPDRLPRWDWLNWYMGNFQPTVDTRVIVGTLNDQTQNALLEVSLALRAYNLDHGSYPSKLSQLVPAYLHSVPTDPFDSGAPIKYRLSGNSYLLYSVGPDGSDDGGKPCIDPSSPKKARYLVDADSKGDIVAGVNIY